MLIQRIHGPTPGADDLLTGTCPTCGTTVQLPRWQAQAPKPPSALGTNPGVWSDLWSAECPVCKERSPRKVGTRVYVAKRKNHEGRSTNAERMTNDGMTKEAQMPNA